MSVIRSIARGSCLISLFVLLAGCVIVPPGGDHEGYREGSYDQPHHRYRHDHEWHECHEHDDPHCR